MQRFLLDLALRRFVPRRHRALIIATFIASRFVWKAAVGSPRVVFREELAPGDSIRITTRSSD